MFSRERIPFGCTVARIHAHTQILLLFYCNFWSLIFSLKCIEFLVVCLRDGWWAEDTNYGKFKMVMLPRENILAFIVAFGNFQFMVVPHSLM